MGEKLQAKGETGTDGSWRFTLPRDLSQFPSDLLEDTLRTARLMVADVELELSRRRQQNDNGDSGKVLTIAEAAARLRCKKDSLYRRWRRLRLGFIDPLDKRWKVTERELYRYLARQQR